MNYDTEAYISLAALQHNLQQVRSYAPNSKIMAMIKADGYGHGLLKIAKALTDVDAFGVACLGEALILRKAGIDKRVVILRSFDDGSELAFMTKHKLDIVVHNKTQLEILQQTELSQPITVWLKIDTGMHRLGFSIKDAQQAYHQLNKIPQVQDPVHILTHLADADDLSKSTTQEQLNCFKQFAHLHPKSIANSAGIIAWPESHADWVRPGIMLYGISPFKNKTGQELGLQPVMTLQSKLIAVKQLQKGDKIGYGGTWRCPENMPIGIVAIGYGDGYPWHAKSGTPVLVNGVKCQLVGRVSMDMLTIDLRNNPAAKIGDPVILWGKGLPIENIAKCADTISYELLCRVKHRV